MAKPYNTTIANLGFRGNLAVVVGKLRGNMGIAECKHIVPKLVVLAYISDAFMEKGLNALKNEPENKEEYLRAIALQDAKGGEQS